MVQSKFIAVLTLILLLIFTPAVYGHSINEDTMTHSNTTRDEEQNLISSQNVLYRLKFTSKDTLLEINGENKNNKKVTSTLNVLVDGKYAYSAKLNLSSDEMWGEKLDVTKHLVVSENEHTVTISTYGNHTRFNFTREINSTNQNKIPTPTITDVTVRNGTIDGHPSSVADVTIKNPSIHTYPTKLMVHTQETDGSFYGASVPPGESRTITVELLDERGQTIAGEARLYTGNLTTEEGAMDQVEFVGQADGETSRWNASYEPVNPPWMEEEYQYHNESLADPSWAERVSRGYGIGGVPAVYIGIGGIVAALLTGIVRRTI